MFFLSILHTFVDIEDQSLESCIFFETLIYEKDKRSKFFTFSLLQMDCATLTFDIYNYINLKSFLSNFMPKMTNFPLQYFEQFENNQFIEYLDYAFFTLM